MLALAASLALAAGGRAQDEAEPRCEYCLEDPALMAAAGVVSHGGFEFGTGTTDDVEGLLSMADLVWIETEHFELGFGLGPYKVKQDEKNKIREELGRLQLALPEVDVRVKQNDPWLRAHLYAQRLEEVYDHFQRLMQVKDSDFPKSETVWNRTTPYMGVGPYLGQVGKYEVLILPSQAASMLYLEKQFGLLIKRTQRWNLIDRDTISATIHVDQGNLRSDAPLHGHVAFNVAINLLDGYKHYNYDIPVWLREGLAHYMERWISPKHNTFDSSEGSVADTGSKSDWGKEVVSLIREEEAPRLAELMALRTYAELEKRHHYVTWSLVQWMVDTKPGSLACLAGALKAQIDEAGYPDGSDMPTAHREAVQKCLGMNYLQLDAAWREWAQTAY
jgi:hypothetical protein